MIAEITGNKVKLYGTIWSGDGRDVVSAIEKAKLKGEINVHLHTAGGSVFDGHLIYNFLRNLENNINIYIDGLCASMGTIIMLAGDTINIAENGYIMIHAPSGATWGTAKDHRSNMRLLESMEANFITKYKNKTGKSKEEVKKWLDGDNWFDASQAKKEGLVDDIVGEILDEEEITTATAEFKNIEASLIKKEKLEIKNNNKMDIKVN